MKYLFFILSLGLYCSAFSQEDALAKNLNKYIQSDDFEHAYVSNRMFHAILKTDANELTPNVRDLLKDIKGMRQLSTQKEGRKYFDEFSQLFESRGFENVLSLKRGNGRINMYLKNENKPDGELILAIQQGNSVSLTSFIGSINLEKMASLSKALNIEGAEYIPQAKKK